MTNALITRCLPSIIPYDIRDMIINYTINLRRLNILRNTLRFLRNTLRYRCNICRRKMKHTEIIRHPAFYRMELFNNNVITNNIICYKCNTICEIKEEIENPNNMATFTRRFIMSETYREWVDYEEYVNDYIRTIYDINYDNAYDIFRI
jgi:hypothetical protein